MIVLISKKDFMEDKKKLFKARPGKLFLINGTDDDHVNVVKGCENPLHGLRAKKSLRDKGAKAVMGKSKYEANVKEYLNSEDMMIAFKAATGKLFSPDRRSKKPDLGWLVLIILENKEYDIFGDAIKKKYAKMMKLDEPEELIVKYDDFDIFKDIYRHQLKKQMNKIEDKIEDVEESKYMPNRDKKDKIDDLEDEYDELKKLMDDTSKKKARHYFLTKVTPKKKLRKNAEAFMKKYKKDSFIEDGWARGVR